MEVHRAHQDVADDICDKPTQLGLALQEQGHRHPTLYQVMKKCIKWFMWTDFSLPSVIFFKLRHRRESWCTRW
jgi:hypothetical protein